MIYIVAILIFTACQAKTTIVSVTTPHIFNVTHNVTKVTKSWDCPPIVVEKIPLAGIDCIREARFRGNGTECRQSSICHKETCDELKLTSMNCINYKWINAGCAEWKNQATTTRKNCKCIEWMWELVLPVLPTCCRLNVTISSFYDQSVNLTHVVAPCNQSLNWPLGKSWSTFKTVNITKTNSFVTSGASTLTSNLSDVLIFSLFIVINMYKM
jgi:hypothetical protein